MTRSIFDPSGGNTEHSGSTFTGPEGSQVSHLPSDVIDGEVPGDDEETLEGVDRADDTPSPLATSADEAAQRLSAMTDPGPTPDE